jgi:hypothetical protein
MKYLLKINIITIILFSLPISAWAHGTEEEHQQELLFPSIMMYGFFTLLGLLLLSILLVWYTSSKINQINVKTQSGRNEKAGKEKLNKLLITSTGILVLGAVTTGVLAFKDNTTTAEPQSNNGSSSVDFMHIHGLGFSNDGSEVYVPAHDGLRVFKEGKWSVVEGEQHDYMGFNMVDDGFYSSGHPGPGSNLKNPFGVIKSTDMGKNLEILDLYGEVDFHGMSVGYKSHAIYVLNPQANSRMSGTGLYYTLDDANTWNKSELSGKDGKTSSIAIHPTDNATIVMTTDKGVLVSSDYGNQFKKVLPNLATSSTFNIEGKLVIGNVDNGVSLTELDLNSGEKKQISTPEMDQDDAISYIAVNPQNVEEIVFTTFKKDIFYTEDFGTTWEKIADKGIATK